MSTSSRRQAQRKQRQEKSWKTASANTTISPLSNNLATSPHPYHASPTPPYSQIDQRITSSNSQPSDLSVDEHSGTQAESLLEYSDTSGEEREDAYFLADPSSRGGASRLLGDDPGETGESSSSVDAPLPRVPQTIASVSALKKFEVSMKFDCFWAFGEKLTLCE